jgi:hypothetical protein
MSSIHDDFPEPATLDGVWSGVIARSATDANDTVDVTINALGNKHRFGPCRWVTKESTLPTRGKDCLVVFDESDTPFVIAWWV